jgi:hypothetical protein
VKKLLAEKKLGGGKNLSDRDLSMLRMIDRDFQHEVLEKLSRMEARMEILMGNGQPGRMTLAEDRIMRLERNDVRRTVIELFVNAGVAVLVSVAVALSGHRWK